MVNGWKMRLSVLILGTLFCVASVAIPFLLWYPPDLKFQVRGDLEIFGFDAQGWISVENVIAKRFNFFESNFNVNVPIEDCRIDSLRIIKGKEKGSAFYDAVLFNASGELNIKANNVSLFSYEAQQQDSDGTLSFVSQNVESFVPSSDRTGLVFWFRSNTSETLNVFLSEGNGRELFLDFGADNGALEVIGEQNFTLPLINDRAGILLTVSVPRNRVYTARIAGELQQVSVSDFSMVNYVFFRRIENASFFKAFYPKGELAYGDRIRELAGSQDLNLTDFSGVVNLMPTSHPNLLRALVGGKTSLIVMGSPEKQRVLSPRNAWEIIFPSPFPFSWIGFGIIVATSLWCLKPSRKDFVGLSFIAVSLFGLLGWSIYNEKPQWIQNTLAYAALLATVIGYLLHKPKSDKNHDLEHQVQTSEEKENSDVKDGKAEQHSMEEGKYKLWYLGIVTSISASFTVACAVQSANSTGFAKILWSVFFIVGGTFFFETNQKVGKIMGVPKIYLTALRIATLLIVVSGVLGIVITYLIK
jgi:hypothetical protein